MTIDDKKQALIEKIEDARRAFSSLIEGVDPVLVIHADSGWRLYDILVHVAAWEREAVAAGRAHIEGEPELPLQNIPKFNHDSYEAGKHDDVQKVRADWESVYDELIDVVNSAPDDVWFKKFIYSWGERGTLANL